MPAASAPACQGLLPARSCLVLCSRECDDERGQGTTFMAGAASPLPACCTPGARSALGHTATRQVFSKTNTFHVHRRRPHHKGPRARGGGCSPGSSHSPQHEGPVPKAPATVCIPLMRVPSGPRLPAESSGKRMVPTLVVLPFVLGLP